VIKDRRYKNKRKRNTSLKWLLIGGLFFCLLGALAYFSIWSPYFWIKEIEISSIKESKYYSKEEILEITQKVLQEKLWRFIPQKSLFLASASGIKESVFDRFSEIRLVEVSRKLPHSLVIGIEEREPIGTWCQIEYLGENSTSTDRTRKVKDCFNIDQEGIIFKKSPLIHSSFVLNIYQEKKDSVNLRDHVASPQVMDSIIKIKSDLDKIKTTDNLSLSVADFKIISEEELRVKTNFGWEIYFNPSYSTESQLKTLELVLSEEIKEEYRSLNYLDLRIQGRVYYQ